jgi:hypothetical protein
MAYDVKQSKTYTQAADAVTNSAVAVIQTLGGVTTKKNKPDQGRLDANFNKKIKGEYMNNRVQLQVQIKAQSSQECVVSAEAYPVDPMGMKLTFGVKGKPAQQVLDVFFAELDNQIKA